MPAIALPELPEGIEFEEYIAAYLQTGGFYLDRSIIERGAAEILELDILASSYSANAIPTIYLAEVKSRGWGFSDIFKVKGWMTYLGLDRGYFIEIERKEAQEYFREKAAELGIALTLVESLADAPQILQQSIGLARVDHEANKWWRFSYWIERKLISTLKRLKKENLEKKCFKAIDEYLFLVTSRTFFTPNLLERVEQLYSNFQKFPNLSAKCAHELDGKSFDDDHQDIPQGVFKRAYYDCVQNELAITTYVEHRSRLAILKNAVDFILYKKNGDPRSDEKKQSMEVFGRKMEWSLLDTLPDAFRNGMEEISKEPYFHRYPIFWQWFMWYFGGFILTDLRDAEYTMFSEATGIPVDEIPNALSAYDRVFPKSGGWFFDTGGRAHFEILHLFPMPFRGLGANVRRVRYAANKRFDEIAVEGQYTKSDLSKWNNLAYSVLSTP